MQSYNPGFLPTTHGRHSSCCREVLVRAQPQAVLVVIIEAEGIDSLSKEAVLSLILNSFN